VLENTVLPYDYCLKCIKIPPSPKHVTSIQNLKTVTDKIGWRVQYQDRVVDGWFQVHVPDQGLLYFDGQPLTLVLGS
jgi:hypothetical protein